MGEDLFSMDIVINETCISSSGTKIANFYGEREGGAGRYTRGTEREACHTLSLDDHPSYTQ